MESLPTAARDGSPETNNSTKSDDGSRQLDAGRGSPPPNCAICLGKCKNKSFTDSCLHQFCFECLLTWSKVKAECPLCKQIFRSIIHNVRSNSQYEEYMVGQRTAEESSERIDIDNLTATRRFRYRTTLTLPRQESLAIQQLLLQHYPIVAELFPAATAPRRRTPASFRRTVYRYSLWARPLPDFTRRFRACTPEFYRHNPSQMQRLVPWLSRELLYLLNENVGQIEYVVAKVLELLPQYSIDSNELRNALQRYLREHTDHFLHELYCFASTPYDLTGYDRHVQYTTDSSISIMINEVVSSADSDASTASDVVLISASELTDPPPTTSRQAMEDPHYRQRCIRVVPSSRVVPIETISQSDTDDDSSEVMVVGYIKPPENRTLEIVDLIGSDSDEVEQGNATARPSQSQNAPESTSTSRVQITLQKNNNSVAPGRRESPPRAGPARSPVQLPQRRTTRQPQPTNTDGSSRPTPLPSPLPTPPAPYVRGSSPLTIDSSYGCESTSDSHGEPSTNNDGPKRRRRKKKRAYRQRRHELQAALEKGEQSKNKSFYGIGVKSSKICTTGESSTATAGPENSQLQPTNPGPAQPERAQPQRVQPEQAQQQRIQMDSAQCQSAQLQCTQPEQAQQQRVQSDRAQSESAQQQRSQPVSVQPEQAQQQRVQPNRVQSECAQPEQAQQQRVQPEQAQQQRVQPVSAQQQCTQPVSAQSEQAQQQRVQPNRVPSECAQPEQAQQQRVQPEQAQQQRVQPVSAQQQCTQPVSAQPEQAQQQRVQPNRVQSECAQQQSAQQELSQQQQEQPQRAQPERVQQQRSQPKHSHPERTQTERTQPDRGQSQRAHLERAPPERAQLECEQPERAQKKRAQPERASQQRVQPERTQSQRARSVRTQPSRTQPSRTQPSRSQPSRSQSRREEPERVLDQPSTNGKPRSRKRLRRPESARRYQLSRESKRLKSVVKVINGHKHSVHCSDFSDTDSDDLPLNVSVMKGLRK